jgi:hypothetical protein
MVTIIKQQNQIFDNLRNQNNLLLGFIIIFIGILFFSGEMSKEYLFVYFSILFSFIFSIIMFYLSMNLLSEDKLKNKKILNASRVLILLSVCFLLSSIIIFFYLSLYT